MEISDTHPLPPTSILITGCTGYIGGRLKQALENSPYQIRCLVRHPCSSQSQNKNTSYIVGDASDKKALIKALSGIDIAYYLIHSMGSKEDFSEKDREVAIQFALAASKCGVKKIIYLGGLGSHYDKLSAHLQSRHEVGNILRLNAEGVQVIEFRASIVIGSGSLSFEMIKHLVERLPVMITPKWVWTKTQPIAVDDLLNYLIKAIEYKFEGNPIFEIGGKDRVSYGELMQEYAKQKGLKRYMIAVPFLTPYLSSLWLGLVTPLYARVGKKLVESAACPTIVHDPLATHYFNTHPKSVREAISAAIHNESHAYPITRWNDSLSAARCGKEVESHPFGERVFDIKEITVPVKPDQAFTPIRQIGGNKGYYFANWLWHLRGLIDLLMGGVGFRRGRRDPENIKTGDVIDFWRVHEYKPNQYLKLFAEMKVPGKAWLEYQVEPYQNGSKIIQKATFDPSGVAGILYWYFLYPVHHLVFSGMLNGISRSILKEKK